MADNSSKAYEIYRFIQDMQKEQIKNKTIKPEDVIKISENDFIRELQDTVNFYTKGTTNTRIIDDVYSNISTMIKNVSSIDEIISGKDIKIPVEVIAKSVDMAVQKNELNAVNIKEEIKDTQTAILIAQFELLKSPEERTKYIENLSSEERRDLKKGVIGKTFKEPISTKLQEEVDSEYERKESQEYKDADERSRSVSDTVAKNNGLSTFVKKNLGITATLTDAQEINLYAIIDRMMKPGANIDAIINDNIAFLKEFMDPEQIKEFENKVRNIDEETQKAWDECNKCERLRRDYVKQNKGTFTEILHKYSIPEEVVEQFSDQDYVTIFRDSFDLEGNLDTIKIQKRLKEVIRGNKTISTDTQYAEVVENQLENTDPEVLRKYFKDIFLGAKEYINSYIGENTPAQDSQQIPQEVPKPNMGEKVPKPVQEPVDPEVAKAASFFTFTANDMMSFAAFTPSIGMEQDKTDFMNAFASFAQIPDASVTPVYEASTDEIQVDPAIHGMVDEERPTPPVTEENETDVRGSGADGTTPPDIVTEETELDGDEESPKDQETEENEKTQNTYGKDSFPGLIKAAEITINDMRATQNELNPKDQNRINETNELDDDKDTK